MHWENANWLGNKTIFKFKSNLIKCIHKTFFCVKYFSVIYCIRDSQYFWKNAHFLHYNVCIYVCMYDKQCKIRRNIWVTNKYKKKNFILSLPKKISPPNIILRENQMFLKSKNLCQFCETIYFRKYTMSCCIQLRNFT